MNGIGYLLTTDIHAYIESDVRMFRLVSSCLHSIVESVEAGGLSRKHLDGESDMYDEEGKAAPRRVCGRRPINPPTDVRLA